MTLKFSKGLIRLATRNDAALLASWWADGEIMAHAGFPHGIKTDINLLKEKLAKPNKKNLIFILETLKHTPIGEMSYHVNGRVATIGIKICDFKYQEKGYGTGALKRLITHLFDDLEVEKIVLDTMIENTRAQHVYKRLGFKKVKINEAVWTDQLGQKRTSVDFEFDKDDYTINKLFYLS